MDLLKSVVVYTVFFGIANMFDGKVNTFTFCCGACAAIFNDIFDHLQDTKDTEK